MKNIFITGATGTIGSRVIADLLKDKTTKLSLLIRAKNSGQANLKVTKLLEFWNVDVSQLKRIKVVLGDITQTNLGIDTKKYNDLIKDTTHIIHMASALKLNMTKKQARTIILESTKEIVKLSKKCEKFVRFNYMSTMEVSGNLSGTIKEEFITQKRKFLNTYEMAKSETEEFLKSEIEEGLPVTIYRPSMVVGDSMTGKTFTFQSFYRMMNDIFINPKSSIIPGSKSFNLDTIPVNYISEAIVTLYDNPDAKNKIFNLVSGVNSTDFETLLKIVPKSVSKNLYITNPKIKLISPKIVYTVLSILQYLTFGKLKKEIKINLIFIKFFFLRVKFDNTNLKTIAKINVPPIKNYLDNLLIYYDEHR